MLDVGDLDAEIVGEDAADPDRCGHLVFGRGDAPALEVFGLADAALRRNEDARVAERARREDRDGDERRLIRVERLHVRGERHLGGIELLEARLAPERLLDLERQVDEVDAFHAHAAVGERARAVVGPAGEGEAKSLHDSRERLAMIESMTRRAARTSAGDTPRTARRFTASASGTSFASSARPLAVRCT